MSLWEKWEKEKLEKQGIKVERRPDDVKIYDARPKANMHRQVWIVLGVAAACLVVVYAVMVVEALSSGRRWSDTYFVGLLAQKQAQRETMSDGQR